MRGLYRWWRLSKKDRLPDLSGLLGGRLVGACTFVYLYAFMSVAFCILQLNYHGEPQMGSVYRNSKRYSQRRDLETDLNVIISGPSTGSLPRDVAHLKAYTWEYNITPSYTSAHAYLLLVFLFDTLPVQQARECGAATSVLTLMWESVSYRSLELLSALADDRYRRSRKKTCLSIPR